MKERPTTVQHGVTQDMPLPGFYPCITTQLNITRYASGQIGRFVIVTREPSAGIELHRDFMESGDWVDVASAARLAFNQATTNMYWLQEGRND